MYKRSFLPFLRLLVPLVAITVLPLTAAAQNAANLPPKPSIVYKVQSPNERLEMTVKTSRILTMDQKIPQAQVNNPDILELTPLSPNQIQVSAKAIGVTQINLWGEDQKVFTVDVIVFGDARELEMLLRSTYPSAALKVVPVSNSVMISGFVDKPEHVDRIIRIAEEYYPKVINNMTVGGVQQVMLHVKVMEVSRTKLRRLGFDWGKITGSSTVVSGPSGLMSDISTGSTVTGVYRSGAPSTFAFNIVDGSSSFYGVLDALRQDNLLKIMSEPTLVTVSGRPASFNSGGQIPIPVPQSLGTLSIEWKDYGTKIDFVPIVLGNGRIRLEVRPEVSELDASQSQIINGSVVPGIKTRNADTGVEMQAGQTLAIAGLVQTRIEALNVGLPWVSELPYIGAAFRKVQETENDVELLILVTPDWAEAMDACEVPQCGPGQQTTNPSDWELFMKGYLEVPKCVPANGNCAGNGDCQDNGNGPDGPPPDGMLLNPGERIPTPSPSDAAGRPVRNGPAGTVAARQTRSGSQSAGPQNRYTSPKSNSSPSDTPTRSQNGPPGLIGPVGYDVVK